MCACLFTLLSKMAASAKQILLLFILGIFLYGVFDFVANFENNGCEMTYMYSTPEYLVSLYIVSVLMQLFDADV